MYFKTTILRSNPQVIREFEMADEHTIIQLFQVLEILHEWKRECEFSLLHNGEEVHVEKQIADAFTKETLEDEWIIEIIPKENPYFGKSEVWKMRLVPCPGIDHEGNVALPRVIRFRGLNPDLSMGSLSKWNERAKQLTERGALYDYSKGYIYEEEYRFKPESVEPKLLRLNAATESIIVDWNKGRSLEKILSALTTDDLKNIIQNQRLSVRYNQRKELIVKDLVRCYDKPEFWMRILKEMSFWEYENFKEEIQVGSVLGEYGIPTLMTYGLVYGDYFSGWYLPTQLLNFYDNLLESEGDQALIEEKKVKEAFECGCNLYGFFTKDMACRLGDIMYPEVELSKKIDTYWKSQGTYFIVNTNQWYAKEKLFGIRKSDPGIELMIDMGNIRGEDAVRAYRMLSQTEIKPYIPSREEAIEIARAGLFFDDDAADELEEELEELLRYPIYHIGDAVDRIYELCHLNYKTSEVIKRLKAEYPLTTDANAYRSLTETINRYKGTVRQIMFAGHTGDEALELYHLRMEE